MMLDFTFSALRDLLLRVAGEGGAVSGKRLGKWLSRISGRVVDGFRFEMKRDASHGNRFLLRPVLGTDAQPDEGLGAIGG
jgi:putative DNA primase/helicase